MAENGNGTHKTSALPFGPNGRVQPTVLMEEKYEN